MNRRRLGGAAGFGDGSQARAHGFVLDGAQVPDRAGQCLSRVVDFDVLKIASQRYGGGSTQTDTCGAVGNKVTGVHVAPLGHGLLALQRGVQRLISTSFLSFIGAQISVSPQVVLPVSSAQSVPSGL